MSDHLVRILTSDGSIRASAAVTTDLVEEVRRRQQSDPTATVAAGRLTTAAALMGSLLKGRQRVALTVEGNGPLRKIQAEADATGIVRASLKVPVAGLPPRGERFDVAGAIGKAGFLHVVKDIGLKDPYRSMVQLQTSEIAEDIAYYFTTSEQTPSTVALGVELGQEAEVVAAGGFLLQLMPDGDAQLVERLETRLAGLPPTTTLLRQGVSPLELLDRLFEGIPYRNLGSTPLVFACSCNREQVTRMLKSLGSDELEQLIDDPGEATVTCEFCKEAYHFDRESLISLRA